MSDAPRRKLIEVALPLQAINQACVREKSIRQGHPSTLHLWWARRPLAACRAVLFASLVDDPSSRPSDFPTEEAQEAERQRLFLLIEKLVTWKATTDAGILEAAREEIRRSTDGKPPAVLDPFCGGGSIPLEAQRLGLDAYGSDLNPVAVLITKSLIEIPPRFSGKPPVNPEAREKLQTGDWSGPQGLADDIRYYGRWMRAEAEKQVGHLYPKATLPDSSRATVISWFWARTVTCPNPACGAEMPLVRSFALSTKKGAEAWIEPIIDRASKNVDFAVHTDDRKPPEGTVNRSGARCLVCDAPAAFPHIRAEGKRNGLGRRLMAVAAETGRGRTYVAASKDHEVAAQSADPGWIPTEELAENPRDFKTPNYGLATIGDLFTDRQLTVLTVLSDLVSDVRVRATEQAEHSSLPKDDRGLDEGGAGPRAYGEAVATYASLVVSRLTDYNSSICSWHSGRQTIRNTFARQAIPMVWDYVEANPLSGSTGSIESATTWVARAVSTVPVGVQGRVSQRDAVAAIEDSSAMCVSTDPPYYDNIGYADLSDYFYVWLRRSLRTTFPDLFSTVLTPKAPELIATPYRFDGNKDLAKAHFETGLGAAFSRMSQIQNEDFPITVYYAFKQAEDESGDVASTGWETMLEGLLEAGLGIVGTWPMRSELANRMLASGTNALASSVVLVCRPRADTASLATRKEFMAALRAELPDSLRHLQEGSIAPVDLAQASIGPGMAIFSRYSKIVEADGEPMRVRTALALINDALDELLVEQEADFDPDTRWCVGWFEQYGMDEGPYGIAETLSRAKNTSTDGLVEAGVLSSTAGKVRLLERGELDQDWDPSQDTRLTVWEVTQHLIRRLEEGGEEAAADLLRQVGGVAEPARELAYRLFQICDRKQWAEQALGYNSLAGAWLEITRLASAASPPDSSDQRSLL